jgi:probable rRNA maturation factor
MPSKSKVCFFFDDQKLSLQNRARLKRFIESIFKKEKKLLGSINYIFCSDKKLLEINRRFLHHDFYTDIVTFNLSETNIIQAEVYISSSRVRENARTHGVSFKSEIHRVIFHGALHLCGYGDMSKRETKVMRELETKYLNKYF